MKNTGTDEVRAAYARVGELICELDKQKEVNANLVQIMHAIVDGELDVARLEFHADKLTIKATKDVDRVNEAEEF